MRFYVEPSPAGGWCVRLAGADAPVSRHDTEEEALARRDAYRIGASREPSTGENVTLRDGSHVLIRPVRPDDKPLFVAGFESLSAESRYLRFMGHKKALSLRDLEFFTELDQAEHAAIGALEPFTGEGLAVARYMRYPKDPRSAEAAVVVIDAWQGRGLGSVLLDRLVKRAHEHGIERFCASLFIDNHAMLALFERIGEVHVVDHEGPAMEIDVALHVDDERALKQALRVAARGDVEGSGLDPA
jgi:RimJ/RimL family protein N-acetyltransferase